ncbi:MAG: SUF system NifU family Fe-S cluster assembly protein [Lachnospiraceae bacterium]|nr:SUF system NifU family Fe-S cluster assembly protein [Lachnospiraceae bacterium]
MEIKDLYREIVNEHNLYPAHRGEMEKPDLILEGVNPSCGDDIYLQLKLDENGVVTEGLFNGSGCAISQASADMMLDLIIGKDKEEALKLAEGFMSMVRSTATPEQIEALDEAAALESIAHMPARVKCATLGWKTMQKMLNGEADKVSTENDLE